MIASEILALFFCALSIILLSMVLYQRKFLDTMHKQYLEKETVQTQITDRYKSVIARYQHEIEALQQEVNQLKQEQKELKHQPNVVVNVSQLGPQTLTIDKEQIRQSSEYFQQQIARLMIKAVKEAEVTLGEEAPRPKFTTSWDLRPYMRTNWFRRLFCSRNQK